MGYDAFSPVSLAQINTLCVPATRISKSEFRACVNALKSFSRQRIKSTSSTPDSEGNSFSGGWTLLNISDEYEFDDLSNLYPLETNREPQLVVGIVQAHASGESNNNTLQVDLNKTVSLFKEHTAVYQNVIARAVIVFGGSKAPGNDSCFWVDTSGSGPGPSDAVAELIQAVHRGLPGVMEKLQRQKFDLPKFSDSSRRSSISTNGPYGPSSPTTSDGRQRETPNQGYEAASNQSIVFGMLHLQAGQWSNALRLCSEGAVSARNVGDYLWHAKALETLLTCMLLLIWARFDFNIPQICFSGSERHGYAIQSPSMFNILSTNRANSASLFGTTSTSTIHILTELLPNLVSTILGLYERGLSQVSSSVPFRLLSEARLRWTNLLIIMKLHGSTLSQLTLNDIVEENSGAKEQDRSRASSTIVLSLPKLALTQILVEAALEAQVKLEIRPAASIHAAIARSFSSLGIERKQGFHLKQFLQRLIPALVEARRRRTTELGVPPSLSSPPPTEQFDVMATASPSGIRSILSIIAKVYGLQKINEQIDKFDVDSSLRRLQNALAYWNGVYGTGDIFVKLEILGMCIEAADAVPDPYSSLYFTSCLLQASKQVLTVNAKPSIGAPLIAPDDLPHLLANIRRAVAAAEQLGSPAARAVYWDKFLVRDVYFLDEENPGRPITHAAHELPVVAKDEFNSRKAHPELKKDPFIFNPFAKARVSAAELVITIDDLVNFTVVLQNPLDVEIEIESITLLTKGCRFQPSDHSIVLGPFCLQSFVLSGVPLETGNMQIIGCKATIKDCYSETYLILPNEYKSSNVAKQKSRAKRYRFVQETGFPSRKEISLKVIDALPSLSISSADLVQPLVMLLEGESIYFDLTLHNDSSLDIDFVTLTFTDSITVQLKEALGNKDLNPAEIHELQFQILNKPAIRCISDQEDLRIPANSDITLRFQVNGRAGLRYASILVDYAHLGKSVSDVKEIFYTRQLTYTVDTTINGSVEIPRCVILPFQDEMKLTGLEKLGGSVLHGTLETEALARARNELCILQLDMRNVWPMPLEVEFSATRPIIEEFDHTGNESENYTVSEVLQPGQLKRILLLLPRIFISNPRAMIPNLDARRQFVVSASKMSIEAEAASREVFWYREKLLECLKADWKEQVGTRQGQVDLRKSLRLNVRMIDSLGTDLVKVNFTLQSESDHEGGEYIESTGVYHYRLAKNHPARLITHVHNRGNTELFLMLRLQPSLRNQSHGVALDLSKRFVWSGALQQAIFPALKPGQTAKLDLGIIALNTGEFEINGMVEEIQRSNPQASEDGLELVFENQRRIWYARNPCSIDAFEPHEK